MTIGNAIFQGIVQGLTEFLPVSSSGHLSLVQYFTGQGGGEDGILFTVLLHLGTLLAVFLAFWKTIAELIVEFFVMISDIVRGRSSLRNATPRRRMLLLLMLSLLPMVISLFLRDWFVAVATDESIFAEGIFFLVTSAMIFLATRRSNGRKTAKEMRGVDALVIGTVQAFAPLPGISRSGSTISAGLMLGLEKRYAVAFSFIMGIPPVLGANVLEIGDAMRDGMNLPLIPVIIGIIFSLIFGLLAIKMLRYMVVSDKFKYFGWYTLVLGILVLIAAMIEHITDGALRSLVMALIG